MRGLDGNDTLNGGTANDILDGGVGNDSLLGGGGNDTLLGGEGNDILNGQGGTDTVNYETATAGVSVNLATTTAQNTVGAGTDTISNIENLVGSAFNDTLVGSAAANLITAGAGNDTLTGAGGADTLDGGAGSDLYILSSLADMPATEVMADTGTGQADVDELRYTANTTGTLTLGTSLAGIERVVVGTGTAAQAVSTGTTAININAAAVSTGLTLVGNSGANSLTGTDATDSLQGGAGNDNLVGNAGDDTLDGGLGNDALQGGTGNDTYIVDAVGDTVDELQGAITDVDTVLASVSYSLALASAAGVENLSLTGTAAIDGTGNALDNTLVGNAAANQLLGQDGDDTLTGAGGNDTLNGGAGQDEAVYSGAASDYEIRYQDNGFFLTHLNGGADGVDFLVDVETLRFADQAITMPLGASVHAVSGVVVEGQSGSTTMVFEVRLSQPATQATTVAYQLEFNGANAADAADLAVDTPLLGTLVFAADESVKTIEIQIAGDTVWEADQVFQVRLTSIVPGALVLAPQAQVTIQNDDIFQMTSTSFVGTTANDLVNGSAGNDVIDGGAGNDVLTGDVGADTLTGGAGSDFLNGGEGADLYLLNALADFAANEQINDNGTSGVDELRIADLAASSWVLGANVTGLEQVSIGTGSAALAVSTGTAAINVDARTASNGLVILGNNGANLIQGSALADTLTGNVGSDTLEGGAGADLFDGGLGNDSLLGGLGNDVLTAGAGADTLDGGAGADTFRFAAGDTGQTLATSDVIQAYQKGALGTGDVFDYTVNLTLGGSALAATNAQASINQTTGVATFGNNSGTTMADALNDITARFTAAGNAAGEMALFRVNNTGNFNLLVSDGVAGVTANDVLFSLGGVTTIGGITLTNGNLNVVI